MIAYSATKRETNLWENSLQLLIKNNIKHGNKNQLMYRIEQGKIRPSKNLADQLAYMLKGNQEFVMIDDQKVVFMTAIEHAVKASYGVILNSAGIPRETGGGQSAMRARPDGEYASSRTPAMQAEKFIRNFQANTKSRTSSYAQQ